MKNKGAGKPSQHAATQSLYSQTMGLKWPKYLLEFYNILHTV